LNLKPYHCGINSCQAAFGDPSSCSRHRKEIHRRVGSYQCPVPGCSSKSVSLNNVSIQLLIATLSIKRRSAFTAHLKRHHGVRLDRAAIDKMHHVTLLSSKPFATPADTALELAPAPPSLAATYSPQMPNIPENPSDGELHRVIGHNLLTSCISVEFSQDAFYHYISQALQNMDAQCFNDNSSLITSSTCAGPVATVSNRNYYLDSQSPSLSPPSLSNSLTASPTSFLSPHYLDTPRDAGNISPSIQYLSPLPSLASLPQLNYDVPSYDESYTALFGKPDDFYYLFPNCGLEQGTEL
jgi:hypothetical protein